VNSSEDQWALPRAQEFGRVNIDDRGIGRAKVYGVREGLGINLLCERQTVSSGFGQADHSSSQVVPAVLRCTPVLNLAMAA